MDDAAGELHCAVRTIWRDLRVLENAGFPTYDEAQADGRRSLWKVEDTFRRQLPLKLSLAEIAALLMSRELLAPAGVLGSAIASSVEEREGVLAQDAADLLEPAALREALRRDAEALAQKLTARRMLGSPAPAIRDERPLASHLRSRTS